MQFASAILLYSVWLAAAGVAGEPSPNTSPGNASSNSTPAPHWSVRRLGDGPIVRPDMLPADDGVWSGDLNFPSVLRVPDWIEKPLGKYYLYFSAHHGSYIRLAYADRMEGPWKVYAPGTLRLVQVEAVNHIAKADSAAKEQGERHVASPDVHVFGDEHRIRLYFHYWLPKLGHQSSVAFSKDGLHFDPQPGAIAGPYLRVVEREYDTLGFDDRGALLTSTDGIAPFKPLSDAVSKVADEASDHRAFRHGCLLVTEDTLAVLYTRIGDAPERIFLSQLMALGDPKAWRASHPQELMAPERDYEGANEKLEPSTFRGQTKVRQLRDPYLFRDEGRTYLLYAVAGETGIALAETTKP